ncbi:MAG: carboxypeptidase-like regulatory domain-containing protein [Planctomycetota bacterium]
MSRRKLFVGFVFAVLMAIGFIVYITNTPSDRDAREKDKRTSAEGNATPDVNNAIGVEFMENSEAEPGRFVALEDELLAETSRYLEIYGFVRSAAGERLGGIEVSVRSLDRIEDESPDSRKLLAKVATASDGSFIIQKLPFRTTLVVANAGDFAPGIAIIDRTWLAGSSERVGPLAITLEKGIEVSGKVILPNGGDAAGAEISYEMERPTPLIDGVYCNFGAGGAAAVLCDSQGKFNFKNVPRPASEAFVLFAKWKDHSGILQLDREGSNCSNVEIILNPQIRVAGKIVNETGEPVALARIAFGRASATSATGGEFQLQIDARDEKIPGKCVVSAPGYAFCSVDLNPAAPPANLTITVSRGAVVEGRVMNDRGEALPGALVTAEGRLLAPGNSKVTDPGRASSDARAHRIETAHVRSDSEGKFRFDNLPKELLLMSVRAAGLPTSKNFKMISPPAQNVIFEIPAAPAGFGNIEGRVVDRATRRAISKFRLFATTPWGEFSATTTPDGEFRLARVPAGTIKLHITPRAGASFQAVERLFILDPGESRKDLLFDVGGEGSVRFVYEAPADSANAKIKPILLPLEGDAVAGGAIDAPDPVQGIVKWENVPPGLYQIAIVDGAFSLTSQLRIRVSPGEAVEARGALTSGHPLLIIIEAADGAATLAPCGVRVRDAKTGSVIFDRRPGGVRMLTMSGAQLVVPSGEYVISIDRADQTVSEKRAAVSSGADAIVKFTIDADPPK